MKHASPANFVPDLASPSIGGLSYALRNLKTLMPDFKWDYGHCASCALAVGARLWEPQRDYMQSVELGHLLGITERQATRAFCCLGSIIAMEQRPVEPEDVANALEYIPLDDD